jgi:hypothetical protein
MTLDYDGLKELARELGRPAYTLYALAADNDPFYITPGRQAEAEWFAEQWHNLGLVDVHYRRIHYRLLSGTAPIALRDGSAYENTEKCWEALCNAARDSVTMELVPADAFVDRRNNEPLIRLQGESDAGIDVRDSEMMLFDLGDRPDLPSLRLSRPTIPQRYHIEVWVEKTTINDILEPLADRYKLNVQTGVGELSGIYCRELVDRAIASGRPVRILYISDFDPGGMSMPVAVARKVEHELYRRNVQLDIQVRPIALTHQQCVDLKLPRTAIKEKERRAKGFEERFGKGATELDALEAIHPGLLRRMIVKEIERYWDPELDQAVNDVCRDVNRELKRITDETVEEFADNIDELQQEWEKIAELHDEWITRAKQVWLAIANRLSSAGDKIGEIEWPEGDEGDEDLDPLFDNTRDYVTQMDRYKAHQDKPTTRKERELGRIEIVCMQCQKTVEVTNPTAKFCGQLCRHKAYRDRRDAAK